MRPRWQFGVIAAIFLTIFTLYPQAKMLYLRGDDWNGHYAYNDIDEVAYASYVRALIDGRPRKNDPYSGRDDAPGSPQPESLFSIQFAAPYTLAIPARVFGFGAPWAMTLSGAAAGFLSALAGFWLLFRLTQNNWFAMAGSLAVFAGGALAAGEGALPEIIWDGFSYPYFPGFRRYIPAMAMPAVFAMFGLVWALVSERDDADKSERSGSRTAILTALAVLCFAYTVYSYFYIWTTAAAWLGALVLVWVVFRPEGFAADLRRFVPLIAGCLLSLVPYAYLLSQRSETLDHVQLLVYTRMPDLWRVPEYIGAACLVLIAIGAARGVFGIRERTALFAMSLSLVPLIVFNQQIITGRSLQPIHYQVFIGNYVAAMALAATIGLFFAKALKANRKMVPALCTAVTILAAVWGFVECHYTVRVLDEANVIRDEALPVARRLEQLAGDGPERHLATVLAFDSIFADDMPSVAPQNILWARHQHVFAGLSWEESKERYYQYLYYANVDEERLDRLLQRDFVSQIALFGWGRHTDRLSFDAKPLTYGEIADEVERYAEYRRSFDVLNAANPMLSYLVVNEDAYVDLSNLDRWYERLEGESIGKYRLYHLRLRTGE